MHVLPLFLAEFVIAWPSMLLPHVESLLAEANAAPALPSVDSTDGVAPLSAAAEREIAVQDVPAGDDGGWSFFITPYAWLMGIEGDGTINGQSFDFERKFEDLLEHVDFAGSIFAVAQYERFLIGVLYDHAALSEDDLDVGGEFETDFDLLEFAVGYRLDGWAEGQTIDLALGARVLELDNELTINGVGTFQDDITLTDPMLGVRPSLPLFPSKVDGLVLNPVFALGGGGDSDFVYELAPQVVYAFSDRFNARLGYRRVGYKFENGDDELDVTFAGLMLGLAVKF